MGMPFMRTRSRARLSASCASRRVLVTSRDKVGNVSVVCTSDGTRCRGTRSLRRFLRDSGGCAVCVVGADGHINCTNGSEAAVAVGTTTTCRYISAIFAVRSLTTLQCHKESAPCARISSRGARIAVRSRILRPLSRELSKLEASTAI